MTHRTTLSFSYSSPESARRVERAIEPEVGDIDDERSEMQLSRTRGTLELRVKAADFTALRAALNTWLSLVRVAEESSGGVAADGSEAG